MMHELAELTLSLELYGSQVQIAQLQFDQCINVSSPH